MANYSNWLVGCTHHLLTNIRLPILHTEFNREKKEKRRRCKCKPRHRKNIFWNAPLTSKMSVFESSKNDAQLMLWYIYYLQRRSKRDDWKSCIWTEWRTLKRNGWRTRERKKRMTCCKQNHGNCKVSERGVSLEGLYFITSAVCS